MGHHCTPVARGAHEAARGRGYTRLPANTHHSRDPFPPFRTREDLHARSSHSRPSTLRSAASAAHFVQPDVQQRSRHRKGPRGQGSGALLLCGPSFPAMRSKYRSGEASHCLPNSDPRRFPPPKPQTPLLVGGHRTASVDERVQQRTASRKTSWSAGCSCAGGGGDSGGSAPMRLLRVAPLPPPSPPHH